MRPKKIYLRENELEDQFMCERMVSCDASIGSCNVEYTDVSQVWHDASEEPENGSNIIAIDKDGLWWDIQPYHSSDYDKYGLEGWPCCKICYNNIQKWAYISDLLPKY